PGHARWQFQHDQPVALRPSEHAGGAAGQQLRRGRPQGSEPAHVRRAGLAGHHADHQHPGQPGSATGRREGGQALMATAPPPDKNQPTDPLAGINLAELKKSLLRSRNFFGALLTLLVILLTLVAIWPLFSVLLVVIVRGGSEISAALFTE